MKNKFKPIAIAAIPIKTAYTVLTTFDSVRRIQNESQIIHTAQERMASQLLENTAERKNSTLMIFIPFSEHIASNNFDTALIPFSDYRSLSSLYFLFARCFSSFDTFIACNSARIEARSVFLCIVSEMASKLVPFITPG